MSLVSARRARWLPGRISQTDESPAFFVREILDVGRRKKVKVISRKYTESRDYTPVGWSIRTVNPPSLKAFCPWAGD